MTDAFSPSARSKVKRLPKRGHYDRATVYAILDTGFICHVGYAINGQPYVTPTAYWREGDAVYWPIYNLDLKNPHAKAGLEHADPKELIASMRSHELEVMRLLGEIEALVSEVEA